MGASPEEGHKDDQRAGTPRLGRKSGGTGLVQLGEEHPLPMAGSWNKMLFAIPSTLAIL